MRAEQLAVKVIPLGAHKTNIIIENKTSEPLSIRLPSAFAAVPILAQIGGGMGPGGNLGGGGGLFGGGGANQGGQGTGQGLAVALVSKAATTRWRPIWRRSIRWWRPVRWRPVRWWAVRRRWLLPRSISSRNRSACKTASNHSLS